MLYIFNLEDVIYALIESFLYVSEVIAWKQLPYQ